MCAVSYCKVVLSVLVAVTYCNAERILGIVPTPSYSHQIAFHPLWKELSLRGHQVTVITTDPINDPALTNLTEIDVHDVYKLLDHSKIFNIKSPFKIMDILKQAFLKVTHFELQHPEVQALIKNKSVHFDLLMVEYLIPGMLAFSERFNCPYIGLTSLDASSHAHSTIGNTVHPGLYPDITLPFVGKLSFMKRVISTLYNFFMKYTCHDIITMQEPLIKKYFGDGYPSLEEIYQNISMLFVNVNPILYNVFRPNVPTVINIGGGSHIQPPKPLPKDLQKYLDSAENGFIYLSFGTNTKSQFLSNETRQFMLEVFSELPYKILWKFELDDLPGKSDNVLISKFFPQQDIFRHPNLKLFITQGGVQSIEEAIFINHIPMIVIPFMADQPKNAERIAGQGLGLVLDYKTLDKKTFKDTILEVTENSKYRNKVKEIAKLAADEPMTGLERAIWWTEYVLRHKGAKHLRSPVIDMPTYQYYLLDVIIFILASILVVFYIFIKILKLLIRIIKYIVRRTKVKKE